MDETVRDLESFAPFMEAPVDVVQRLKLELLLPNEYLYGAHTLFYA